MHIMIALAKSLACENTEPSTEPVLKNGTEILVDDDNNPNTPRVPKIIIMDHYDHSSLSDLAMDVVTRISGQQEIISKDRLADSLIQVKNQSEVEARRKIAEVKDESSTVYAGESSEPYTVAADLICKFDTDYFLLESEETSNTLCLTADEFSSEFPEDLVLETSI
jgi:hypothetical protein